MFFSQIMGLRDVYIPTLFSNTGKSLPLIRASAVCMGAPRPWQSYFNETPEAFLPEVCLHFAHTAPRPPVFSLPAETGCRWVTRTAVLYALTGHQVQEGTRRKAREGWRETNAAPRQLLRREAAPYAEKGTGNSHEC